MADYPIAVITGASRGIGRAIAIGLAGKGYKTLLIARSKDKLEEIADQIKQKTNGKKELDPEIFQLDLRNVDQINKVFEGIISRFEKIDVLVNNAGIYEEGTLDANADKLKDVLDVNLVAPYAILQSVVPQMKKQKSGYIFNVASRAGKIGFPTSGVYCSSKFGLVGINESLYKELDEFGIKVTALCPGWVNTGMAVEARSPIQPEEMIQPEDLIKTVSWLLDLSPTVRVKEVLIECSKSVN